MCYTLFRKLVNLTRQWDGCCDYSTSSSCNSFFFLFFNFSSNPWNSLFRQIRYNFIQSSVVCQYSIFRALTCEIQNYKSFFYILIYIKHNWTNFDMYKNVVVFLKILHIFLSYKSHIYIYLYHSIHSLLKINEESHAFTNV